MKLIKKGILFYILLIGLSVVIQSCCETNIKIIGNGNMSISQFDNFRQDTINNEFRIVLNLDVLYAGNFYTSGIISSTYATQCAENFLNKIKRESIELTCDKDFIFQSQTIEAATNFLDENKMLVLIDDEGGTIEIHFNQEFLNDATFSLGDHRFELKIETSDDNTFTNKASTYLKL